MLALLAVVFALVLLLAAVVLLGGGPAPGGRLVPKGLLGGGPAPGGRVVPKGLLALDVVPKAVPRGTLFPKTVSVPERPPKPLPNDDCPNAPLGALKGGTDLLLKSQGFGETEGAVGAVLASRVLLLGGWP